MDPNALEAGHVKQLRHIVAKAIGEGEVAKEICDAEFTVSENNRFARFKNLRKELIQLAAISVARVESLEQNELQSGSHSRSF